MPINFIKMLKKIILLLLFIVVCSCKPDAKETLAALNAKPKVAKDSTIVGADKDENGCLASAGYTWSKVNKECVQVFSGIGLAPIAKSNETDAALYSYVFFNEDGNLAEVFLPNQGNSMILSRENKKSPWIYNDYKLITKNGYILEKSKVAIFSGDGEAGSKISGTDVEED